MSDTPSAGSRDVPGAVGVFLVLATDNTPVTTWQHWLLVGTALHGTLAGLAGFGHCAYLARKSRKAGKPENSV
jgi:hypothetical protein